MSTLLNLFKEFLPLIPFLMVGERRTGSRSSVSVTRLIEAFIIAGISGSVAVYGTTVRLASELDQLARVQAQIKADMQEVKELARKTRETQVEVLAARGVRLDNIERKIDLIERRMK